MTRTLTLKLFTDAKTGSLAMTVTNSETEGEDNSVEKHSVSTTDLWGSEGALRTAVDSTVQSYLAALEEDRASNLTPIERAARGE